MVSGKTNTPLVGANLLSTTNIGTKTNISGEFNINVTSNDTLKISFIGFKTIKYIVPQKENGKYLIKFRLYKDSIALSEVEVFPWPSYKEFKKAFLAINKEEDKIKMEDVNMYIDKSTTPYTPSIFSPASFIYDKLFDKKAKIKRRLTRRRKTIKKSKTGEK